MSSFGIPNFIKNSALLKEIENAIGNGDSFVEAIKRINRAQSSASELAIVTALSITFFAGRIIAKNRKLIFFFPNWTYDLLQSFFSPLNTLLGWIPYFLPTRNSIFSEVGFEKVKLIGSGADLNSVKAAIINQEDKAFNEEDLVKLYDSCPPIDAKDMLGKSYNGRILRTGRSLLDLADFLIVRPLGLLGLKWGKRYISPHVGDPLLVRWLNTIYFPLPLWGNVGLVNIEWRGVSTATMNYDYQPWKDYFRVLHRDDEKNQLILIGVWCHRNIAGGWFTLNYDPEVPKVTGARSGIIGVSNFIQVTK